jgi:hypothetical protein
MNIEFMHGGITMLFILAGLFFFRFWRDTLDRLFLLFALSFWLQALTRMGLAFVGGQEERAYLYLLRLLAFLLIIAAISMKNVSRTGTSGDVVE